MGNINTDKHIEGDQGMKTCKPKDDQLGKEKQKHTETEDDLG